MYICVQVMRYIVENLEYLQLTFWKSIASLRGGGVWRLEICSKVERRIRT